MTDGVTADGRKTTLAPDEIEYLRSFLEAGDRGGFYMAYYAMVGTEDAGTAFGKKEASLQTKIATFSGPVGAAAFLSNRVLQEANGSDEYPGIYFISQVVANSALEGLINDLQGGGEGFISDEEFFETAKLAWEDLGLSVLFPGRLLDGGLVDTTARAALVVADYITFLLEEYSSEDGITRAEMLQWAGADGANAALLAAAFVQGRGITGKETSQFGAGAEIVASPDSAQTYVVSDTGKVVAAESDSLLGSGTSSYELLPALVDAALDAAFAAGSALSPALAQLGVASKEAFLSLFVDPIFTPHVPPNWPSVSYPTGEGEQALPVPSSTTPTPHTAAPSDGADTLMGTSGLIFDADSISGAGGDDAIFGGGGGDTLIGGDGDDILWGQEENDELQGGIGDDVLRGGEDDDVLMPGAGSNVVDGGSPARALILNGEDTVDYSDLTDENITVRIEGIVDEGDTGHQFSVSKDSGVDHVVGVERLIGTGLADVIEITAIDERQTDRITFLDLRGNPSSLADTIDLSQFSNSVTVDLRFTGQRVIDNRTDAELIVRGVEGIVGTAFGDTLYAPSFRGAAIKGGGGEDIIIGGSGNDRLTGWDDNERDILTGGGGVDRFEVGDHDIIRGGTGAGTRVYRPTDEGATTSGPALFALNLSAPVPLSPEDPGTLLTGGEAEAPPANPCDPSPDGGEDDGRTYLGADGTEYTLESGRLVVDFGSGTVFVEGFRNGNAGIRLKDARPDTDQAECQRDPLIIDLDGDRNVVRELFDSFAYFDLDNDGFREHVAWTLPGDGFLVRDRNGNGAIDDGSEMFGSGRAERDGGRIVLEGAAGFADLAQLDSNSDGLISAADAEFETLRVWIDANGDALTDEGELKTLAELGLVSISLQTRASDDLDCGCDGTDIIFASNAYFADGSTRTVYDAYLSIDQYDTREIVTDVTVPADFAELPFLLGTGTLSDLDVAMARDPALEEMVRAFASLELSHASEILARAQEILLRWTGADEVAPDSRGSNMNARWLAAIERISGSDFLQAAVGSNPRADAAAIMIEDWQEIVARTAAKLLGQTALGEELLPGLSFEAAAFFSAAEGADLGAILQHAAGLAPDTASELVGFWAGIVAVLDQYHGALDLDAAAFDAAIDAVLANAGLHFDAAELRTVLMADGSSGKVLGTFADGRVGADGDDLIVLGAGAVVDGAAGDDRYVAGSTTGSAEIRDGSGKNTLYLVDHIPTEIVASTEVVDGRYVMRITDTAGTLNVLIGLSVESRGVSSDIDVVVFADGTVSDALGLLPASNMLGNLVIGGSEQIIEGSAADELLVGFGGSNSYRFGAGDGHDTISDREGGADRLLMRAARDEVAISVARSDSAIDLVLTIIATGETIRIAGQQSSVRSTIEAIEFTDGALSAGDIDQILTTGTAGDDTITGSVRPDEMRGLAGDDVLHGGAGQDVYHFDEGWGSDRVLDEDLGNRVVFGEGILATEVIVSRAGANGSDLRLTVGENELVIAGGLMRTIVPTFEFADGTTVSLIDYVAELNAGPANAIAGTRFADLLVGTTASERFIGNGGRDVFVGNGGLDTYEIGSEGVTIEASDVGIDTAIAPAGSELRDLRFLDSFGLHLSFGAGFAGSVAYGSLEYIRFENGDELSFADGNVTAGTADDDYLIHLDNAPATFTPGAGDDVMIGATGESNRDIYHFEVGFGHDVIYDMGGQNDEIQFFGAELSRDNAELARVDSDLVISFVSGDRLTIEGFFWDYSYPPDVPYFGKEEGVIEWIYFGGPNEDWSAQAIVESLSAPTAGDDWIMHGPISSRDGGAGNDILVGGDQAERYVFSTGYGHDVIKDSGAGHFRTDTVDFVGLSSGEVTFSRAADDPTSVVATIIATGETLTVDGTPHDGFNQYWLPTSDRHQGSLRIDEYRFTDRVLTFDEVAQLVLDSESTEGDDRLFGFNESDRIDPGEGNDHISVMEGYDTIVLRPDGGHDVLDFLSTRRQYEIELEFVGIAPSDVVFLRVNEYEGRPGRHLLVRTGEDSSLLILNGLETSLYPGGEGGPRGLIRASFPEHEFYWDSNADPSTWLGRLDGPRFQGTAGADVLQGVFTDPEWEPEGPSDPVVFDPGGGDDLIFGSNAGTDTVLFDVDSGVDRYVANGAWLSVMLGSDVSSADIALRWLPDEPGMIELSIVGTGDRLLFDGTALARIEAADVTFTVGGIDPDDPELLTPIELEPGWLVEAGQGRERFVALDGGVTLEFDSGAGTDFFEDARFRAALEGTGDLVDWTPSEIVLGGSSDLTEYRFLRYDTNPDDLVIVGPSGERLTIRDQFALGVPEVSDGWQPADPDGDGEIDWQGFDLDADGNPDFALLDSTGDGVPDWQAADFDGDGQSDWADYREAYAILDGGEVFAEDVDFDGNFDFYSVYTGQSVALRDITGDGIPDEYSLDETVWIAGPTDGNGALDWSLLDADNDGTFELAAFFSSGLDWIGNYVSGSEHAGWSVWNYGEVYNPVADSWLWRANDIGGPVYYFENQDYSALVLARDSDGDGIPDQVGVDRDYDDQPDPVVISAPQMVVDRLSFGGPAEWDFPNYSIAELMHRIEFVGASEVELDLEALKPVASENADALLLGPGASLDSLAGDDVVTSFGAGGELRWSAGDGNDVLRAASIFEPADLAVRFDGIVDPGQLRFLRSGEDGQDLVVELVATGERLLIEGQLGSPDGVPDVGLTPPVARFVFDGGLELSAGAVASRVEGIDLGGTNVIDSSGEGGVLDGGAGDDLLRGGTGDDIYLFGEAYAEDRIEDAGGTDRIRFGEGIEPTSLYFSRTGAAGEDLLIEVMGTERLALTVADQFADPSARIETLAFADGETMSWRDVQRQILDIATTDGDDVITGFLEDDTIRGGGGHDRLAGAGGNDLILGGAGRDTAVFSGPRSDYAIVFGDGVVTVTDTVAGRDGADRLENVEDLEFLGDAAAFEVAPANSAPTISGPLSFSMAEDAILSIPLAQLLASATDADGDALQLVSLSSTGHGSAWIGAAGDIRFRPDADFSGAAGFSFTLSDGNGGTVTGDAEVEVAPAPDAPRQVSALESLVILEDGTVDFTVPPSAFADPDGDTLVLAARLADGAPLPEWLQFDGARLTGTPPPDFNGTLELAITASDGTHEIAAPLVLEVLPVNDAPRLAIQPPDLAVAPGEAFAFTLPDGSFTDPEGDALTYRVLLADGGALPGWLTADGLSLSGVAPEDLAGPVELALVADDGRAIGYTTFSLAVSANRAPEPGDPIEPVAFPEDSAVSFAVPAGAFVDPDGGPLTYSLTLAGGAPLPAWLQFDGILLTGTPPADFNGTLEIAVTASDGTASATSSFTLAIDPVNDAPVVLQPLVQVSVEEDGVLDFAVPAGWAGDVDGDPLELAVTMADGSPLPEWLSFDGSRLTGSPPPNFNGALALAIGASDGAASATDPFTLAVTPVNDAPSLASALPDLEVAEGEAIDWTIPAETFVDVDGDALVRTATLADGSALPAWLAFDGLRFTGHADAVPGGVLEIVVSASDGELSASDTFLLAVDAGNRAPVAASDGVYVTTSNREIVIDPADLLANDLDPDGDALTVTAVGSASHGEVEFGADGHIVYIPDAAYVGNAEFTYSVSDGAETVSATVSVTIDPSDQFDGWRSGNDNGNILLGSLFGTNRIFGAGGNDAITGGLSSDQLSGGDGNDALLGLTGDDHLWGGQGDDWLFGGPGLDTAYLFGYRESYVLETQGGLLSLRLSDTASTTDGDDGVDQLSSVERLSFKGGETLNVVSPIILDLAGDGIQTLDASRSRARFDFDGDGRGDDVSWIGRNDAFLFLDRDGNGKVSGAEEITFIDDLPNAASDLAGLRAFDSNADGRLDSADDRFADFGLWRDADGDGRVDRGETFSLSQAGIASLDLAGTPHEAVTALGDVAILNTGTYTRVDGSTHEFADAALTYFSGQPGRGPGSRPSLDLELGPRGLRIDPRDGGLDDTRWEDAAVHRGAWGASQPGALDGDPIEWGALAPRFFGPDHGLGDGIADLRGFAIRHDWSEFLVGGTDGSIPLI